MTAAERKLRLFPGSRIERERDAPGWLVVRGDYGWVFGSRHEAVLTARELDRETRQ